MKNKNLFTAIAYCFLAIALVLFISGCRSKKSTTDFKQTEIENVSVIDNSVVKKTLRAEENKQETKTETFTDKSFFEAWMSFESDKITITDTAGNKTEITNPRVNKKSSQTNDIAKSDVVVAKNEITTTNEENQQRERKENTQRETKTDLQQKESSKGKEPFWMWIVGGCVVGGLGYFVLKRFGLV